MEVRLIEHTPIAEDVDLVGPYRTDELEAQRNIEQKKPGRCHPLANERALHALWAFTVERLMRQVAVQLDARALVESIEQIPGRL